MAPMCMYTADERGFANDWHYSHYISRAVGGVGLIILEATAVTPNGRISSNDLGIWQDDHVEGLKKIVNGCHKEGSKVGIQLAHAGRKCKAAGEVTVAPSSFEFSNDYPTPKELSKEEIKNVVDSFKKGARRAEEAGFDTIEIHAAHGYLINQFLSPLANRRDDEYGGTLDNRVRFLKEILKAIKEVWPSDKPILVRVSAEDYHEKGIDIKEMVEIVNHIKDDVDMIHVSSGGVVAANIDVYPGYQIKYAETIKNQCHIPTIAVGLISNYEQAEEIISNKRADLVALGRELLRNPYWVLNTANANKIKIQYPIQYERAIK